MKNLIKPDYNLNLASTGDRIANLFIDTILVSVIYTLVTSFHIVEKTNSGSIQLIVFWLFYYFAFEIIFGKTPGKFITGTRVVQENGQLPEFSNILIRTLCRLIPLDPLSFLNNNLGWHDSISKTRVIKEAKKINVREEISEGENELNI